MSRKVLFLCLTAASVLAARAFSQSFLSQYKGVPYHDSRYQAGPQKIPGRVLCAYYVELAITEETVKSCPALEKLDQR